MRNFAFFLALALLALPWGCETTRSKPTANRPPTYGDLCPPSQDPVIQRDQMDVLGLEDGLAQAQHDLEILRIQYRERDLQDRSMKAHQKNDPAGIAKADGAIQDQEARRNHEEQWLALKRQWVEDLKAGDCLGAQNTSWQLQNLR